LKRPISRATLKIIDWVILISAAAYLLMSFLEALGNPYTSVFAATVLMANGLLAIVGLRIALDRSYLLFTVFFTFNLLFLSVAPLQQIAFNFDPIFSNLGLLRESSLLCLVMTLAGLGAVVYRPHRKAGQNSAVGFLDKSLVERGRANFLFLAAITVFLSAVLIAFYGSNLLATSREAFGDIEIDRSANILSDAFLRPFTFVAPLIGAVVAYHRRNRGWIVIFSVLVLVGVLINNPLVSARFRSSALIVFGILSIFGWYRVRLFLSVYLAGLLVSPIFGSIFRYRDAQLDERYFSSFFVHPDFSGIDIFCYTILWADLKGFEYGSNIIAGILFFIPRSIWTAKGKTVGEVISEYVLYLKDFGTDNVSSPPPVEGYLSLGIVGAIMMSIAVVLLIDWVERRGMQAERFSPFYFLLCLSPMLCMILLRGPFVVGFSEWTMHSFAVLTASVLLATGISSRTAQTSRLGTTAQQTFVR
jgi:hypothetical protein